MNQPSTASDGEEARRVFLAIGVPSDVREAVATAQQTFMRTGARVSWVRKENIHLTLVFLGELIPKRIATVCEAMDEICSNAPGFEFCVAGAGFFGSPSHPRILWAGIVDPPDALISLQRALTDRLVAKGFDADRKRFKPHLTIGRVRGAAGVDALTSALSLANNTPFGTVPVQRVFLIQSHLQSHLESQGVRYTMYHETELKGTRDHGR